MDTKSFLKGARYYCAKLTEETALFSCIFGELALMRDATFLSTLPSTEK